MIISNLYEDVPKYRKKKKSSVSSSKTKSKHKHKYVDCLLSNGRFTIKSEYCKICGKIGKCDYFGFLGSEDILKKYKNLKIMQIDSIFDKYVTRGIV